MKIQINTNDLQNMLKKSKGLELRKLNIDFQKGLLVSTGTEGIKLIMYNLETQIKSIISGDVTEPGQVLIPEQTLNLLENFKNGPITITSDSIVYGTKEIKFVSGPLDAYGELDMLGVPMFKLFETTEAELNHLLEVKYATTTNATRPNLEGINIYKNKFAATNAYCISTRESDQFHIYENIVISQNLWKTLLKAVDKKSKNPVKVFWDQKKIISFQFNDFEITGKLLEGTFLDIEKILKVKNVTKITLKTKELLKTVRLMKKLKADKKLIKLCVDNPLKIESGDNENTIIDEISVDEFKGQPLEIWFNVDCFYDVLNQFKNEIVDVGFSYNIRPMIIKSDKKLEFLLPVKPRTENECET